MSISYKPNDYNSASPYLIVDGAGQTVEFLKKVFDAEELRLITDEEDNIRHGEVRIDDSVIMLSDGAPPDFPSIPSMVHIYVKDVDATFKRALKAGAEAIQEPVQKDAEDKRGGVKDAGGTSWWISTKVE